MSLNTYQVQANKDKFFFLLANVSTLTANSISTLTLNSGFANITTIKSKELDSEFVSSFAINTDTISSQNLEANFAFISEATVLGGFISSLVTNNILLDGNSLDTGGAGAGATLLLNGFPIVTAALSSFSSLSDWAYFPAASTLQMGMNSISNAGNIQCMNINSQNIYNALTIQTDTLSALTNFTSPSGNVTNFRTTNFSTTNAVTSNLIVGSNATIPNLSVTTLTGQVAQFQGLSSLTVSTGSINGTPYTPASNWSAFPATQTVQMNQNTLAGGSNFAITASNLTITASNAFSNICDDFSVIADEGANIASVANINLTAQNGTYGSIALTANGGFNNGVNGVVNITANGGQVGGVGQGGSINLTANTPLGFSNLTSKISLNASGINSYAGVVPPLASAFGYNFIYGTNGVYIASGLPPGLPNVPGTTYIYGTLGIEMPSDAYMKNIYPYWDGLTTPPDLTITGRYIIPNAAQVCVQMSNIKRIDFQSNVTTYMSNCDEITMSANGVINTSNFTTTNGTIGTLSNTTIVGSGAGSISGYSNITTSNLNTTTINGAAYPPPSGGASTISTFTTASISTATIATAFISSIQKPASFLEINTPTITFTTPGGTNLNNIQNIFGTTGSNLQINSATVTINGQPGGWVKVGTTTTGDPDTFFLPNATVSTQSVLLSSINNFMSFGTKSAKINGDVAQLQLFNTASSVGNNLNLLARQSYSEIQSYNSSFTTPTSLLFNADNFGFNVNPADITGGFEMDISGSTQIRNGGLQVTDFISTSTLTPDTLTVQNIDGLVNVNGKAYYTFGEFLTTSTITVSAANTPTIIPFDTNTVGNETSLNTGAIEVAQAGLYEFKMSIQFDKSGGGVDEVDFWVKVNGNDVANTASKVVVAGTNGETLGTFFTYLNLNRNDLVEIAFASGDPTMAATAFPAWVTPGDPYDRPAIPAVVANIILIR